MNKTLLGCLFFSLLLTILYILTTNIIELNLKTLNRISPTTELQKENNAKLGALRLSPSEVKDLVYKLNTQVSLLKEIKWYAKLVFGVLIFILLWCARKLSFKTAQFDALVLLILTSLLFSIHWLMLQYGSLFEEGNNAIINARIIISVGLIIAQPFLFYFAYLWNNFEISKQIHTQKWISIVALILAILTGITTLILGLAILFTPQLGGNIT